jgi:hypothetical protein
MNTVTGAWCQFTGEKANCWAVFNDMLYYGGNTGLVKQADCQGFDDDGAIEFDIETAFNYCGSRGRMKQFTMCRPLLTSDGSIAPQIAVNVDFDRRSPGNLVSFTQGSFAQWDVAEWDVDVWPEEQALIANWVSVSGLGYCASIRMFGSVSTASGQESNSFTLQLNGFDMLGLAGSYL